MNPPTLVGAALTAASLLVTQSSPAGSPVQVSRFRSCNSTIKETRPLTISVYKDYKMQMQSTFTVAKTCLFLLEIR